MFKLTQFPKKKSNLQITAGLLGISALIIGSQAHAADSFYTNTANTTFTLTSGDTLDATATSASNYFYGIHNGSSATNFNVQLNDGSTINANSGSTTGIYTVGVYTQSSNATVNANNLTVNSIGVDARGLMLLSTNGTTNLGSDSTINVNSLTGTSQYNSGIYVSNRGSLIAEKLTIETQGTNTFGLYLSNASSANLGSGSRIHTTGSYGMGVSISSGANATSFEADALTIQTDGSIAGGGASFTSSGVNTVSTIGVGSKIIANNSNAIRADAGSTINFKGTATQRNTIFSGASSYGGAILASQAGSIINLENTDVTVDIGAASSNAGLWAQTNGTINGKNITVNMLQNGFGVMAYNPGGTINLEGTNVVSVSNTQYAALYAPLGNLTATGKMTVTGNAIADQGGTMNLTLDSASAIKGDLSAKTNGTINLILAANSNLTGKATTVDASNGVLNLTLTNSNWNVTGDSSLSTLAMNNGNVSFKQIGTTVTTQNLSGSGTFNMQADVVGGTGDQLIVTGTSAGNHHLNVKSSGSDATTGNETLTLVQTSDAGAAFDLTNQVDLGGYRYNLRQNGNNWELYSSGLTPTADGTLSFINTSYLLNYAETQTLLQRMGELRQSENSDGDVWVRAFTGKFDSFGGGKLDGFDMDYTGLQAGIDKRLNVSGADVYLGVMGGTSKADTNYKEGDGDVTGYHFGLYGTYVADNDFYIDAVFKYSNFKNSFNVQSVDYDRINSDVDSDGYGLSLEVGKRFYFDASKAGYYIEPQAQISYAHQGSASTTASDGLNVNMDSYDSTLGRISALVGYEVKNSPTPMNVYFKTGYVTEMSGDTNYSLNGNKESYDFGGDWWENSIGFTAQINKKHNLYLEGTYSSGNKFDQTQLNAGYRYSF